jgi:hypothetical protein
VGGFAVGERHHDSEKNLGLLRSYDNDDDPAARFTPYYGPDNTGRCKVMMQRETSTQNRNH